jgi:hypothetical protein
MWKTADSMPWTVDSDNAYHTVDEGERPCKTSPRRRGGGLSMCRNSQAIRKLLPHNARDRR